MKYTTVCILVMITCALALSGCTDKNDIGSTSSSQISLANDTAAADAILSEGNVSITDTEIQEMEQEMKELEALIIDMEKEENITIEEV